MRHAESVGTARLFVTDHEGEESIIERRRVTFNQAMREATMMMQHNDIENVDVDFMVLPLSQPERTYTPRMTS